MIQEMAEEAGPERKGSVPPVAPPDGDTCRCPAPEPGPALGKLEGREEVLREGQEKKNRSLGMPLQPAPTQVNHLYLGGRAEWRVRLPKRLGSLLV